MKLHRVVIFLLAAIVAVFYAHRGLDSSDTSTTLLFLAVASSFTLIAMLSLSTLVSSREHFLLNFFAWLGAACSLAIIGEAPFGIAALAISIYYAIWGVVELLRKLRHPAE